MHKMVVLPVLLVLVVTCVKGSMDTDMVDSQSETSSTSGMNSLKDGGGGDPNLVNPQRGQGYGLAPLQDNQWTTTSTVPPKKPVPTTPKPTLSQQSMRAVLELGIIVSFHFLLHSKY